MLITFIACLPAQRIMGGFHNWPHMAWFPESLQTVSLDLRAVAWLIGVPG